MESHPVAENWLGSLWFTCRILFCLFLGVVTILEFETIEIEWPTNDSIACIQEKEAGVCGLHKQNV